MKKGKVLLVDDNADMELIGERIFTRAGFEYLSARSGQEGLELALSARPDLIVLDYMLPDINGTQFLRTMTTDADYALLLGTPVVMLTARTDSIEDLDDCFRMGLRIFLNKPFGHRELVNIIESIIRLSRLSSGTAAPAPISSAAAAPVTDYKKMDELRLHAHTIARLAKELRDEAPTLSEQQRMDLNAIYTTSKRMLALLEQSR